MLGPAEPPVATGAPLDSSLYAHWRHQLTARRIVSSGITIPASWQARNPKAAYWESELSPTGGPSRVFLTRRKTLGLGPGSAPPGAESAARFVLAGIGTTSGSPAGPLVSPFSG